jgi:hypothetical protein
LAVNCYVEPVYTLDADLVVVAASLPDVTALLVREGFKTETHPHSVNALAPESKLRIQFTTDERYQAFLARSLEGEVLGVRARSRAWKTSPKASFGFMAILHGASANARRTNWISSGWRRRIRS